MSYTLESVAPLGRSYDEYVRMFSLSASDLSGRILGCADGLASFNAVHTGRGGRVVSIDPLYDFPAPVISARTDETFPETMRQMKLNASEFLWDRIGTVEDLAALRMRAMTTFLEDYPQGKSEGRYLAGGLPNLPFSDMAFDLALCSHFLFLYSEQFSRSFHVRSIRELCRVAAEVRIFPLLELGSRTSRHLEATVNDLREMGYRCSIELVPYEFQRGGNSMLRVAQA